MARTPKPKFIVEAERHLRSVLDTGFDIDDDGDWEIRIARKSLAELLTQPRVRQLLINAFDEDGINGATHQLRAIIKGRRQTDKNPYSNDIELLLSDFFIQVMAARTAIESTMKSPTSKTTKRKRDNS